MSIKELRDFAIKKHGDQKYGNHPYVHHLDMVYAEALAHGLIPLVGRASYGHDVREDTNATEKEVIDVFGEEEAKLIEAVTDEPGKNRKERKEATYGKIKNTPFATPLKLCDRIANVRSCFRSKNKGLLSMYRKEQAEFEKQLKVEGEWLELWETLDKLFKESL